MAALGILQLGDLRWRVDPNSVDWNFQIDTAIINTLGGQVIQMLGATLSDLVITGDFGQDHPNSKLSWQLAAAFHTKIKGLMDRQTLLAKTVTQSQSKAFHTQASKTKILSDAGVIHDPLSLTYHDGMHNWSFKVLIKAIDDADGSGSLNMTTGKFAYKYKLTLFIVESESTLIKKVASDLFLDRISNGLNWKMSPFNGNKKAQDAQDFIVANGGTVSAFLNNAITGVPMTAAPVAPKKPSVSDTTPSPTYPGVAGAAG